MTSSNTTSSSTKPLAVISGPAMTLPVIESTTTVTEMKPSSPQDPTVLEQALVRPAHGGAVHVDVARGDRSRDRCLPVDQVDGHSVLDDDDTVARDARGDGELGVGDEVAPLPVHGHDVAWPNDVVAVEELAGAGVPRHVHLGVPPVDDVRAPGA